jgi:ribosomal protein S18 acetylase RimI-like enzyme
MNIRSFQEADTESVTTLWQTVFPDEPPHNAHAVTIRNKLQVQRELLFVGEIGGVVVGTVLAGYDGHRGWLYAVAVHPNYQRRGLGTLLVQHTEAALAATGCPKINLQVRSTNAAVVAFYQGLGYLAEERISMGKRIAN